MLVDLDCTLYASSRLSASAELLVSSSMKFSQHVEHILSKAATKIFALRTLRAHGMAQASLHDFVRPR